MPPGNVLAKPPTKVIEKTTAEACLSIARRIQLAHHLSGDEPGSEAIRQVAETIRRELLRV